MDNEKIEYGDYVQMDDRFETVHIWTKELEARNNERFVPMKVTKAKYDKEMEKTNTAQPNTIVSTGNIGIGNQYPYGEITINGNGHYGDKSAVQFVHTEGTSMPPTITTSTSDNTQFGTITIPSTNTDNINFVSSGTSSFTYSNQYGAKELIDTIVKEDCIELIYKQNPQWATSPQLLKTKITKDIVKAVGDKLVVVETIDGEWNEEQVIEAHYTFDDGE